MRKIIGLMILLNLLTVNYLLAQDAYSPSIENVENRQWFQDAKYGLFIHWGVYSVMAGGGDKGIAEWIMNRKQIPIEQYEKLPDFFNPVYFDDNSLVEYKQTEYGLILNLPTEKRNKIDTILKLDL